MLVKREIPMKENLMKKILLAALLVGMGSAGLHAEVILNGTLESWGALTNTPPQGAPTSWTVTGKAPTQVPGLMVGSTYAALLPANNTLGTSEIQQIIPTGDRLSEFDFSFVFAASDPGSTTARSLHLQVMTYNGSTYPLAIAMRLVRGSSACTLSLQAYDGIGFVTVAANAFNVSVYDSGANEFSTLNAYNFQISGDFMAAQYSVSYGAIGDAMTTVTNVNLFQNAPSEANGQTLTAIKFAGTQSSGSYAVDNVSVIPEPGAVGLLAVGLLALRAIRRRS